MSRIFQKSLLRDSTDTPLTRFVAFIQSADGIRATDLGATARESYRNIFGHSPFDPDHEDCDLWIEAAWEEASVFCPDDPDTAWRYRTAWDAGFWGGNDPRI